MAGTYQDDVTVANELYWRRRFVRLQQAVNEAFLKNPSDEVLARIAEKAQEGM